MEKSNDKTWIMSGPGFENLNAQNVKNNKGKGVWWTDDINTLLPIKLRETGHGSEQPITIINQMRKQVDKFGANNALNVMKDDVHLKWTWNEYFQNCVNFAKSMGAIGINERSGVAIMGFNGPEWLFTFMGAIAYNCVATGIYTTNSPDACHYQISHCNAELVCCENIDHAKRIMVHIKKMPSIKKIVIWGVKQLPKDLADNKLIMLWNDFMALGKD